MMHVPAQTLVYLLIAFVFIVGCYDPKGSHGESKAQRMELVLIRFLADLDVNECPKGDITALEAWLLSRLDEDDKERWSHKYAPMNPITPDGHVRLRDRWDNALVYQNPSADPRFILRLYSCGPNGIDERGGGDDIDVSPKRGTVK